ncbi:hypothetical protein [Pasteurella testudinis]|uniref:hypothetical protein n=1 Tax=Pasteurella testudinis TaxID=761 RepID=UPI0040598852
MFSAYQNIAENGVDICQSAVKIAPCSDKLADLPKADGLVLLDANYGMSTMYLLSLDPAIVNEHNAQQRNPSVDLYLPENGMGESGANYSQAFKQRYFTALAKRNHAIIAHAQQRKALIDKGEGDFAGDEALIIPAANYLGMNNKLFAQDPSLLAHTQQAWKLLHQDGSVSTQIVPTTRSAKNLSNKGNQYDMALRTTVQRFLPMYAVRLNGDFAITATGLQGVDWESSHTTPVGNVRHISVPSA